MSAAPLLGALLLGLLALAGIVALILWLVRRWQRSLAQTAITEARTVLTEGLRRAELNVGEPLAAETGQLRSQLLDAERGELTALARAAQSLGAPFEDLAAQAQSLARLRAYILPAAETVAESQQVLASLTEWRVPTATLAEVERAVHVILTSAHESQSKLAVARAELGRLLHVQDQWRSYINWYFRQLSGAVALLLPLTILGIIGAVLLGRAGHLTAAFLLAGASGTATSILLKLPPLAVAGETAWFWTRAGSRFAGGLCATAIAYGLLGSGLLGLSLSVGERSMSPAQLMQACGTRGQAAAPAKDGEPAPAGAGESQPACPQTGYMLLLSIAMLFGFSERSLGSFEELLFSVTLRQGSAQPQRSPQRPPPTPPAAPPAAK